MGGKFFLFLAFFLLTACTPNEPTSKQTNNSTTISIEQQKHDALIILEAEESLIKSAQVAPVQVDKLLLQRIEVESEQNEQLLIEMAVSEQTKAELNLIKNAKLESEKKQALLNQAAKAKKDISDFIQN